ncbi:MAG TPA: hydrogenase formation protein HypD [Candidatus Eremiobacteraeota bacterium]|nr:MAG: Hydrogenase isoenzymes formation protein HypD [bacterium ADurb.Bin363]HPZ08336.1 hydrogenase formation protein HypD [Candidatus Eremiobacteraeota bacterium]
MSEIIKEYIKKISPICKMLEEKEISFMEVCGTHTMAISKSGIRDILPEKIRLISGPGCPVCVTSPGDIDGMIKLSDLPDVIITTFGDMIRVPGSNRNSLEIKKADGADIRIIYNPVEAVDMAEKNSDKKVIFLAVGFETTVPGIASAIIEAEKRKTENFFIYPANKVIPPAMRALVMDKQIGIKGFICPGHVSVITGANPYRFLAEDYGIPCVIAGFEPLDIIISIYKLLLQLHEKRASVEIEYSPWVRPEGNIKARDIIYKIFKECDAVWRGLGVIPGSGLSLKEEYSYRDGRKLLKEEIPSVPETAGCRCGEVLKGLIRPPECELFGHVCTPVNPVGPCMVSSEGSCSVYYKYSDG